MAGITAATVIEGMGREGLLTEHPDMFDVVGKEVADDGGCIGTTLSGGLLAYTREQRYIG